MKKFLFIFCSLFIIYFGFGIEVYADEKVTFDTSVLSEDDATLFINSICIDTYGGCNYYCAEGNVSSTDPSYCNDAGGISSFSINHPEKSKDKVYSYVKEALNKNKCGDEKCFEFFKEHYCENKKMINKEMIDFCGYISENVGKAVEDGNTGGKNPSKVYNCPTLSLDLSFSSCSYDSVQLKINYSEDGSIFRFMNDMSDDNNVSIEATEATICDDKFYLHGKGKEVDDFKKAFLKKVKDGNCPSIRWCNNSTKEGGYFHSYAEFGDSCDESVYGPVATSQVTDGDGTSSGLSLDNLNTSASNHVHGLLGDKTSILDCDTLLSGDGESDGIIKILKIIVNIVKFIVPVILIVMGSLDFIQAIFAQDDGAMKKAQGKFIKRVIIAVIIFLIPSALKLILTIAHSIWPAISSDFCGIL